MINTLTRAEAAEFLRVSKHTLARWKSDDRGPVAVKMGRAVRYRREDLEAFLRAGMQPTSDMPVGGSPRRAGEAS